MPIMPTQVQNNKHMCGRVKTSFAEVMAAHEARHF